MKLTKAFLSFLAIAIVLVSCQDRKLSHEDIVHENHARMSAIIKEYDPEGKYMTPEKNLMDPEKYPEEFQNVDWEAFEEAIQYGVALGIITEEQERKNKKYRPLFKEYYRKMKDANSKEEREALRQEYASKIPMDINNGDPESWDPAQWEEVKKRKN